MDARKQMKIQLQDAFSQTLQSETINKTYKAKFTRL